MFACASGGSSVPSPLLAAQASLQSPCPQEDSSGSEMVLVSMSNVWVCVNVRMLKMIHMHIHGDLSCCVCAEFTWAKGCFAFWRRWDCRPSLT